MPYGGVKFDTITFTNAGADTTTTVSGLYASTTSGLTVTGTISGNLIQGTTVSGITVTGTTANFTSGVFTALSGTTTTVTSGIFGAGTAAAPSIAFTGDPNTGIYSPGADQVAVATNGVGRLTIDSNGNVGVVSGGNLGINGASPQSPLDVISNASSYGISLRGRSGDSLAQFRFTSNDHAATYATVETAPTYLAAQVNGSERLRITSAGLVGIGTSSPGSALEVSASVPVITVNSGAANASSIEFKQAGTLYGRVRFDGNNFDIGNLYSGGATIINAGNAERARIDSSGRLLVGTATANTSGAKLQTVDGLTFPATAVASADPNTLDDYEEGTWTPTQDTFDTWTTPTFTATYTKVGRVVHLNLYQTGGTVGWSALDSIGGLPFTPGTIAVGYATDTTPASDNGAIVAYTNSKIYFQKANASETGLVFSVTYHV